MATSEIDPIQITREDERYGGVIGNGFSKLDGHKTTRKQGRLAGGVRDYHSMAMMKARMAALWRDGVNYKDIAETVSDEFQLEGDLRVKVSGIHYHIKEMIAYWREKGLAHMDEKQAMVLARYDQLEVLITEAYFDSKQGIRTKGLERQIERANLPDNRDDIREDVKKRRSKDARTRSLYPDGDLEDTMQMTLERIKEVDRVEENLPGNPKFLQMLIDINDKRAKLWGLLSRKDIVNADQEMAKLSDTQRAERMATILHTALQRKTGDKGNLAPASPLGGFQDGTEPEEVEAEIENIIEPTYSMVPDKVLEVEESEEDFEWDL